jgi:hypothetical protein
MALDRTELACDRRQHRHRCAADQHGRQRQASTLVAERQAVGLDPRPRQHAALGAGRLRLALPACVQARQGVHDVGDVAAHDRARHELHGSGSRTRERAQPAQQRMLPAVAVEHLQSPHHQPVALLEPVGVRERAGGGDLTQ